jgi:hypothetical protein
MRTIGYAHYCVGEDGAEDLVWFAHEVQVNENAARVKFQHHAAMVLPEIGLRLDSTRVSAEGRRL